MLKGWDIAGVNGVGAISTALNGDFIIVKASEGQGWKDPEHDYFVSKGRSWGKLIGHYHYARPDTKDATPPIDPIAEAQDFLKFAGILPGERAALDFEKNEPIELRGDWPEWVINFGQTVNAAIGGRCLIYLNDWFAGQVLKYATDAQKAAIRSIFDLWKAGNLNAYVSSPTASFGSIFGWPKLTGWQWTDLPLDQDIFYGTRADWIAGGRGGYVPPLPKPSLTGPVWPGVYYRYKVPYMTGTNVKWIQLRLNARISAGLATDGIFGGKTGAAVLAYQRKHADLVDDGIVGKDTWNSLRIVP